MKNGRFLATVVGAAAAVLAVASCGDNSARCGDGTRNDDGVCVADVDCGAGTVAVGNECVPDGSVICEQGTVYDQQLGACVPSEDVCGEGTVFLDGECVAEDAALTADHTEAAEPNDGLAAGDGIAGGFPLPAVGESTTFHGCITPYRDRDNNGQLDIDYDLWVIQASGPSLVEITADGVGGLAAGFIALAGNDDVDAAGWLRFGINLTGDTSQRQLYLPTAGAYFILMTDSRSLFLSEGAAGSADTCYYTTVRNVGLPTPTPIAGNAPVNGQIGSNTQFFSYAPDEGQIVIARVATNHPAIEPSLAELRNGAFTRYAAGSTSASFLSGGMSAGDEIVYVVEPVYNYALSPVPFQLSLYAPPVAALPEDGAVTVVNGAADDLVAYFDVGDGEVLHFELSSEEPADFTFMDTSGSVVAGVSGAEHREWVVFPGAGRYYLIIATDASEPDEFEVTTVITRTVPAPIVPGTPIANAEFNDLGAAWYRFDPAASVWLAFHASGANWGGAVVSLDFYRPASVGIPDADFDPVFYYDFFASGATPAEGRIVIGDTNQYLVRVSDYYDQSADSSSSYTLDIRDREFTDLGTITEASPLSEQDLAIDAGGVARYFVRASGDDRVTIGVATSEDVDAVIRALNAVEGVLATANQGGAGEDETLVRSVATPLWVAFEVRNAGGAGSFDLDVTVQSSRPYVVTNGALLYEDICDAEGAVTLSTPNRDDAVTAVQTLPFSFLLHGLPSGNQFRVSTNGFLSFQTQSTAPAFTNAPIPTSAVPNGLVAPYWDDLDDVTICRLDDAEQSTIQWTGVVYGSTTSIAMQAVLHADGGIDYIYGASHQANGSSATVGVESLTGLTGTQVSFNQAGTVAASSSKVLTPE
jgi:hypothetical protein